MTALVDDEILAVGGAAALLVRFSRAVDTRRPVAIALLFTETGLFRPGERELRGRAAIQSFYADRLADSRRVTRHVWANTEIRPSGDREVLLAATLTNYVFEPAIAETTHLQMRIGDVTCRCICDVSGVWRFDEHLYTRVFATRLPLEPSQWSPGNPTS